jgi:hypothetical protein
VSSANSLRILRAAKPKQSSKSHLVENHAALLLPLPDATAIAEGRVAYLSADKRRADIASGRFDDVLSIMQAADDACGVDSDEGPGDSCDLSTAERIHSILELWKQQAVPCVPRENRGERGKAGEPHSAERCLRQLCGLLGVSSISGNSEEEDDEETAGYFQHMAESGDVTVDAVTGAFQVTTSVPAEGHTATLHGLESPPETVVIGADAVKDDGAEKEGPGGCEYRDYHTGYDDNDEYDDNGGYDGDDVWESGFACDDDKDVVNLAAQVADEEEEQEQAEWNEEAMFPQQPGEGGGLSQQLWAEADCVTDQHGNESAGSGYRATYDSDTPANPGKNQ